MEIARVEDAFTVNGHLVLGAIVLVEGLETRADVQALFGEKISLRTPDGDQFMASVLEVNVHQSLGGVTQVMLGIDPPTDRDVPRGTTIISAL